MSYYTIGEFYCGPGGLGLGAKRATIKASDGAVHSFKHLFATDYDPDACATYKKNVCEKCEVICTDIKKLKIESLPYVDGFLYGFPCNDFSNVGEAKGLKGKFGPLYSYGVRYIDLRNPMFFLAENVSGISNANSGSAFTKILEELASAGKKGYDITVHKYKFEEYSIPQARHRFIVIGFRKDLGLTFNVPAPINADKPITCKKALTEKPFHNEAPNQELTRQSKQVIERLKYIKPGENAWSLDLPEHLKLNVRGAKMSMIYKRLDPNKPAYTITGSGGGGTHVYHWKEHRALTNRERARLQTFPDDFKFMGSKESVRKQIGMAVPVDAAEFILRCVLKTLVGKKYKSIKPNFDQKLL